MKNAKPTAKQVDEARRQMSMLAARMGIEYVIVEDEIIDQHCEDNDLTLTDEQRAKAKERIKERLFEVLEESDTLSIIDEEAGE